VINYKKDKIKILVTGTRGIPGIQGGIERHCEELYPRLVKLGCSVTVTRRIPYVNVEQTMYQGVLLKDLPVPRNKHFEAIIHTILSTIYARFKGFKYIHIHAIGPSLVVPLARLFGLKVIVTNHGPDYRRQKWGMISRFFLWLGELMGVIFAHKVIAVSSHIKKRLNNLYNRLDCIYLPNGLKIQKKLKNINFLRKYGLKKDSYIILVGRFVPEKGFHNVIISFSQLKTKGIKLALVGDDHHNIEYCIKLKKMAYEHGCVLTGFVQKEILDQLYSHALLFVLPSYHEGLPLTLLEALSFGVDVLVSDIPAHRELGLGAHSYFKAGDVTDLTAKLKYKLAHPETGVWRKSLLSLYDWDLIAGKTLEVYKNINNSKK